MTRKGICDSRRSGVKTVMFAALGGVGFSQAAL